jgi:hypothetical protein
VRAETLAAWCERWLGSPPTAELFEAGHLSVVKGIHLADGRDVVVKVRPRIPRLAALATVEDSAAFLDAYQQARGRGWTAREYQACWAAGLWQRAFDAKLQSSEREPEILTRQEASARLTLAGLDPGLAAD